MVLNLVAVALFVVSLWLRCRAATGWSVPGFAASTFAFLLLGVSLRAASERETGCR